MTMDGAGLVAVETNPQLYQMTGAALILAPCLGYSVLGLSNANDRSLRGGYSSTKASSTHRVVPL